MVDKKKNYELLPVKRINILTDRCTRKNITIEELNGMTKYPSIYELHLLVRQGKKMKAFGERTNVLKNQMFDVTEKADGTNVRIIIHRNCWDIFIGGRNELLVYNKDLLFNDKDGIVKVLNNLIEPNKIETLMFSVNNLDQKNYEFLVLYGELIGEGIQKRGKKYGEKDFRLFAVKGFIPEVIDSFLTTERNKWHFLRRSNEFNSFLSFSEVSLMAKLLGVRIVPYFGRINIDKLSELKDIIEMLNIRVSSNINNNALSEGLVIHSVEGGDYRHSKEGINFSSFKLKFDNYRR